MYIKLSESKEGEEYEVRGAHGVRLACYRHDSAYMLAILSAYHNGQQQHTNENTRGHTVFWYVTNVLPGVSSAFLIRSR